MSVACTSAASTFARRAFCFVHASDLHLEQPPHGLAEIPEHLRDSLVEAPYRAAERVFDLALGEKADFLVLSGDVLAAGLAGPRGPCFLVKQFQRLQERDIAVYWMPGQVEAHDDWPAHIELPNNVHRFAPGESEFTHRRGGVAIARLIGVGQASSLPTGKTPALVAVNSTGLPTIGVMHVDAELSSSFFPSVQGIEYWALGGRHEMHTVLDDWNKHPGCCATSRVLAHFCGSSQGRSPDERGAHGCTLVTVDDHGVVGHRSMPTDLFRWRRETVTIDETTTAEQLGQACRDRLAQIVARENDVAHLVCWTVKGDGPLARRLSRDGLAAELVEELRSDYGYRNPTAWTVSLSVEHAAPVPSECYEEESVLGDYLRAVRHYQQNEATIDLGAYLARPQDIDEQSLSGLAECASVAIGSGRQRLLEHAAWLGIDLLRPQTPRSGQQQHVTPTGHEAD